MSNLIEKGRRHRFWGTAAHMFVFAFFYMLYLLIDATIGANNPFYPFDWAAKRLFLYFWVPVLVVRLCNCNITAGFMTFGYFFGLILSIPVGTIAYAALHNSDEKRGFYGHLIFWLCVVVVSVALGILLEVRYRKQKRKHLADMDDLGGSN